MKLQGKLWKDGKFWLIQVPVLDAMTQGYTKKEAYLMIKDWIEEFSVDHLPQKLSINVTPGKDNTFEIEADNSMGLFALVLRQLRTQNNLKLEEVKNKLGFKSTSSYAQYEQGKREPSIRQMEELLSAVQPSAKLLISC